MQKISSRQVRVKRNRGFAIRDLRPESMAKKAVVYARVSTDAQDESSQVEMGKQVAHELGYADDEILVIRDHGVSARKVKMRERSGLVKVLKLAESEDVAVMIVRDRDRIARNMIEYLQFWRKLTEAGVSLVLSDREATPISKKFGEEALNAWMAEIDGDKIVSRSKAASKFYPPAPLGYEKIGRKGNTHYEFTEEIDEVRSLFEAFQSVTTKEEYRQFRALWRKRIGRYPDKILQHLMYAAAILDGDAVRSLRHVTPIVEVDTVLENLSRLKEWGFAEEGKPVAAPLRVFVPLFCSRCSAALDERVRKGERAFVCPNCRAVRHPEIQIFDAISETLQHVVISLDEREVRERVLSSVRLHQNREMNEVRKLLEKRLKTGRHLLDAMTLGSPDKMVIEYRNLEKMLEAAFREVQRLQGLALNVEELKTLVTSRSRQMAQHCSEPVQKLLIDHVVVDVDSIVVYHRFADVLHEEEII